MEELNIIYKILRILQRNMDCSEFDKSQLSAEALGMSEPKWCRIMAMLRKEGYVEGVETWKSMGQSYPRVTLTRPEITLKGLSYLEENSLMKKAAAIAKGIADFIP